MNMPVHYRLFEFCIFSISFILIITTNNSCSKLILAYSLAGKPIHCGPVNCSVDENIGQNLQFSRDFTQVWFSPLTNILKTNCKADGRW